MLVALCSWFPANCTVCSMITFLSAKKKIITSSELLITCVLLTYVTSYLAAPFQEKVHEFWQRNLAMFSQL